MATRSQVQRVWASFVLLSSVAAVAAGQPAQRFQNLRSSEARVVRALAACYERSTTCRGLIDTIEASTTIAYVNTGWCRGITPSSCLHFLTMSSGRRLLRITLDPALRGDTALEMLAHELQHAVEIVQAPGVRDEDTLRVLYQTIGYARGEYGTRDEWETHGAQRIAEVVGSELKQTRQPLLQTQR